MKAGLQFAIWPRKSIAHDSGLPVSRPAPTEVTIGHNVSSKTEVDDVMKQVKAAGATIVKPLCCMAALGISCAHAAELSAQSVAGSYEILICKGTCASAGDEEVLLKGRLILFAKNLQPAELAQIHLTDRHMHGAVPNACFAVEKLSGRSYQGYAGIQKVGLTAWSIESNELKFSLYHSPDAGYRVTARGSQTGFTGTGRSWGAGVAAPQEPTIEHIVLRRTGAATVSKCPRGTD